MSNVITLDHIIRRFLFNHGLTLHYYMVVQGHAEDILGMVTLNILGNVKTARLTPDNELKSIPLPDDCVDIGRLSIYRGQILVQSIEFGAISSLFNTDDQGNPIPYSNPSPVETDRMQLYFSSGAAEIMDYNYTDKGEFLGRQFGNGASPNVNSFKYIPGERRIQYLQALGNDTKVEMSYISSDNFFSDTAIVPANAKDMIDAGIEWKMTARRRGAGISEVRDAEERFWNQERIFRARRYPLNIQSILQSVRRGYRQTWKS